MSENKPLCRVEGCGDRALSLSDYCWLHTSDKDSYKAKLLEALNRTKSARGFHLKKIVLEGVELMNIDFSRANLSQSVICNSNLFYNNFSGADLMGSDFSGSDLTGSVMAEADLTRASLLGVRLWHADLTRAILTEANLSGADMWQSKLYGVRLWRADLVTAKYLSRQNFAHKAMKFITVERIDETTHMAAEDAYRILKRWFIAHGRYNDASWASFKEKTMERIRLRKNKDLAYIPIALMGLLCGYGERPQRVILSSGFVMFSYACLFYLLKAVRSPIDPDYTLSFWDYIYYSVVTFTTLGYGDIVPKMNLAFRMLAVSEAFTGAFMMGLFIFTLARKYSAR